MPPALRAPCARRRGSDRRRYCRGSRRLKDCTGRPYGNDNGLGIECVGPLHCHQKSVRLDDVLLVVVCGLAMRRLLVLVLFRTLSRDRLAGRDNVSAILSLLFAQPLDLIGGLGLVGPLFPDIDSFEGTMMR